MSLEGKLIKKLRRRSRWSKYREKDIDSSTFDKTEKSGKIIYKSSRIFKFLKAFQRRLDAKFGINVLAEEPNIRAEVNFTTLARFDFGTSDYGIKAVLASGQARALGVVAGDIIFVLEGSLEGYQLVVESVNYSTDTLRLEDVDKDIIAGVAEITEIVCVADVGEFEEFTLTSASGAVSVQADYFVLEAPNGDLDAYWLDIDAAGTAPTGAAYVASDNQIMVSILSTDSDIQVAGKIAAAITSADITVTDNLDGTVGFVYDLMGAHTAPATYNADDSGSGSIVIVEDNAGVDSNLNSKYFLINSALDATEYYVWLNVNSEGVDPTPLGKTAIPIALSASASASTVATAIQGALTALAAFSATVSISTVENTNAADGATTDAADVDTTFTITVTQQGVTENQLLPSESNDRARILFSGSKGQYK